MTVQTTLGLYIPPGLSPQIPSAAAHLLDQ